MEDVDDVTVVKSKNMESNGVKCYIAKKYHSIEELEQDNNKELLYFDGEFDTTNYSIINNDDRLRRFREELNDEEMKIFLEKELKDKRLADTLVHKAKKSD